MNWQRAIDCDGGNSRPSTRWFAGWTMAWFEIITEVENLLFSQVHSLETGLSSSQVDLEPGWSSVDIKPALPAADCPVAVEFPLSWTEISTHIMS